jgi:hypothetical protein
MTGGEWGATECWLASAGPLALPVVLASGRAVFLSYCGNFAGHARYGTDRVFKDSDFSDRIGIRNKHEKALLVDGAFSFQ